VLAYVTVANVRCLAASRKRVCRLLVPSVEWRQHYSIDTRERAKN